MKEYQNNYYLVIFIFLNLFIGSSQTSSYTFEQYLINQRLKTDHWTYIHFLEKNHLTTEDTIHFYKARYYLNYDEDTLFLKHYFKSKQLFQKDSCHLIKASISALRWSKKSQEQWFLSLDTDLVCKEFKLKEINKIWWSGNKPLNFSAEEFPYPLQKDFLVLQKSVKKKKWKSVLLSVVVPGLGQYYLGQKQTFYIILLQHLLVGGIAAESIYRLGYKNIYSIFTIGVFGTFYFSNIYGAYKETDQIKVRYKKQFYIDAANYYNFYNCQY
jgi:hypothetical protein